MDNSLGGYTQLDEKMWLIILIFVAILAIPMVLGALIANLFYKLGEWWARLKST